MAADWSAEAAAAVERWAATVSGRGGATPGWRRLGTAVPDTPGRLVLDLRGATFGADRLDDVRLSGPRGPDHEPSHPVDELRDDDGVLVMREPPGVPLRRHYVWTRSMSPRFLLDKLAQGLRSADVVPLAEAMVRGELSGPPTARGGAPGLLPAQTEAFRACLSPGVRLVWGPPGTGKTQVLASAIEALVRRGQRVLLVSTANVAVDNALQAVVRRLSAPAGTAIRIGPPKLPEIAADPDVQLERLATTQSVAVDRERDAVATRLGELDALDADVAALRQELVGYDDDAYRQAAERVDAERVLVELHPRQAQAQAEAAAAERGRRQAVDVLRQAEAAHTELDGARRALEHARNAAREIAALGQQQRALEIERDALAVLEAPSGWIARIRHGRRLDAAVEAVRRFVADTAARRANLRKLQLDAHAAAGAVTADSLDAADRQLESARQAAGDGDRRRARVGHALDELGRAAERAHAVSVPSDADRNLVIRAEREDLPRKLVRLRTLEKHRSAGAAQRSALEEQHRGLVDRSRRLRADAEVQLVREARVVATTLARSRVHRALATETFDVVLVDEAGAATFAEVVLALCRGRTTAVLFGDFLQLGPVLESKKIKDDPDPAVQRWVRGTCFSRVAIRTPQDAIAHRSCTALLHQFRFGPELRRLANDVVYEVLEDADVVPGVSARRRTEIVVVDVSTVPDLADIRFPAGAGRWWLAGVVLARALVELHVPDGGVGAVTPYRAQADAVLEALEDRRLVAGAAVGTVHAFQGREYPTIILDLVEDGTGWTAKGRADRGSWEADGLKLFGVGITRVRDRLYVLVDEGAVHTASAGPLRSLRTAMERGEVQRWSAAALLGLDDPPVETVDETFTEVSRLLQQLVTVTDVHDEHSFGSELERHLIGARRSVWMWSPWIANQSQVVVPLIAGAVRRGVDVRVFIRPDDDRNMRRDWAQQQLPDLYASGATVIRSDHEHRKIVVIDGEVVLLGSLNALSNNPGTTRETMITMEGRAFAARLLEELRVEEIGTPRSCDVCQEDMEIRRKGGRTPDLFWRCPRRCGGDVPLQRTESPLSGAGRRAARR